MKKYLLIDHSNMDSDVNVEAFDSLEDAKETMRKEYNAYREVWEKDEILEYDFTWFVDKDAEAQVENIHADRVEWVIKEIEF